MVRAGIEQLERLIAAGDVPGRDTHDWIKRPNRAFGGQTPLQRMRAGDITDLAAVRLYLDAARAPWS